MVAATGVGAGDLATAGFAGSKLGTAILWAVILGAGMKYILNEGLARWQIGSGTTLLEGCIDHLKLPFKIAFIAYLIPWSFFVGAALISACGVAAHSMLPFFNNPQTGKIVFGIVHSMLGLSIVWYGGFKAFERIMQFCIAAMFVAVTATAIILMPPFKQVITGLFVPQIPLLSDGGLTWTVALIGGVGGTLTILSYSYWIREKSVTPDIVGCRFDLGVAYTLTAIFGISMIIIASEVSVSGRGANLIISLAERLGDRIGNTGRWIFLIGAWGAIFSSLLGVWQSVPYIFADFVTKKEEREEILKLEKTTPYKIYLFSIALIPLLGILFSFKEVQKLYSVFGAFFMPFLAFVLLFLNNSKFLPDKKYRNSMWVNALLVLVLLFFGWIAVRSLLQL